MIHAWLLYGFVVFFMLCLILTNDQMKTKVIYLFFPYHYSGLLAPLASKSDSLYSLVIQGKETVRKLLMDITVLYSSNLGPLTHLFVILQNLMRV